MANPLDNLPIVITRDFDVLTTQAREQAMSLRRQRFPRPAARRFTVTAENLEITTELGATLVALDAMLGAAVAFPVTLPIVGTVTVRNDDDSWTYEVANGTLRHFSINLVEEPRIL